MRLTRRKYEAAYESSMLSPNGVQPNGAAALAAMQHAAGQFPAVAGQSPAQLQRSLAEQQQAAALAAFAMANNGKHADGGSKVSPGSGHSSLIAPNSTMAMADHRHQGKASSPIDGRQHSPSSAYLPPTSTAGSANPAFLHPALSFYPPSYAHALAASGHMPSFPFPSYGSASGFGVGTAGAAASASATTPESFFNAANQSMVKSESDSADHGHQRRIWRSIDTEAMDAASNKMDEMQHRKKIKLMDQQQSMVDVVSNGCGGSGNDSNHSGGDRCSSISSAQSHHSRGEAIGGEDSFQDSRVKDEDEDNDDEDEVDVVSSDDHPPVHSPCSPNKRPLSHESSGSNGNGSSGGSNGGGSYTHKLTNHTLSMC